TTPHPAARPWSWRSLRSGRPLAPARPTAPCRPCSRRGTGPGAQVRRGPSEHDVYQRACASKSTAGIGVQLTLARSYAARRPKCISLSTGIARLLATEWPASPRRRLAARPRPTRQTPSSPNRNRPPTGDGRARLSHTPPRGTRSRPKAKGILLKKHSSLDRNRPPTGDGMARLSDTPSRGTRSRPKAKCILLKKHASIDGNRPLTGGGIASLSLQQNPGGPNERQRARLSDDEAN